MENGVNKSDKRCIKTKRAIRNAFAQLLSEKEPGRITVKEICENALINRNTFYAHYAGVYELMDEMENEIIAELDEVIEEYGLLEDYNPHLIFEKLTALIYEDFDFYSHLVSSKGYGTLITKVKAVTKNHMLDVMEEKSKLDREKLSYIFEFVSAGMLALYQQWFESDRSTPLQAVSELAGNLAMDGVNNILPQNRRYPSMDRQGS